MSRWVERVEDRAFARFTGAVTADAELTDVAHRLATLMLSVIRALGVPTGVVLMLQADVAFADAALLGVVALTWVVASVRWELRLPPAQQQRRAGWTVVGDGAALFTAMSLTGGADSPVRLLLVPLPIVLGLIASQRTVVVGSGATALTYALFGGPTALVGATTIALAWATAVGAVIARQRGRSLQRLTAVDDLRRSLATSGSTTRPLEVGREVREAALGPLEAILSRLPGAGRRDVEELSVAVAAIAGRLRSIVVELHVLTARQGGLRGSLEGLVQRRSPDASITLVTPPSLDEEQTLLVASIAREALRAVADATTRHVGLQVVRTATSLSVQVQAAPAPSDEQAQARGARFIAQASAAGATATHLSGGTARAVVDEEVPERAPSWIPGRSLQDARLLMIVLRVPSIVAVLAAGAVAGASDLRFYLVGALVLAWSPVVIRAATRPSGSLGAWIVVATPDVLGLIALAALAGPAREELLPMAVAIPPCYGLLVSVPVTSGVIALLLAGLIATGFGTTEFVVAFAWSSVIAVLLAAGTTALDMSLVRQARSRAILVRRLARNAELERRRIAERLHDETLQLLLAARQDLEEAAAGDEALRSSARAALEAAAATLRRAEGDLAADLDVFPAGPRPALEALADAVAARGGPTVLLQLDERAFGHHDGLVVRLASELVANTVTHAQAERLLVRLARREREVILEVTDDGRGIDPARVRDAVDRGHVGLASCHERVHVIGGEMVLSTAAPGGARVLVTLPLRSGEGSDADT